MADSLSSEAGARRNSPPAVIAEAIAKAVTARKPRTRYATGFGAKPLSTVRKILPERAFNALIKRAIGIRN